jgi:hypothetical protein
MVNDMRPALTRGESRASWLRSWVCELTETRAVALVLARQPSHL